MMLFVKDRMTTCRSHSLPALSSFQNASDWRLISAHYAAAGQHIDPPDLTKAAIRQVVQCADASVSTRKDVRIN
jgi:hypothetical protein